MTKEDLIRELKVLQVMAEEKDEEEAHQKADGLLLEFINDENIAEAFSNIHKWYA